MEYFEKAFYRERVARELAEESLEKKARELYYAHEKLILKQNQLIISEKMASLGMISAGIAHEINNPLSFILSNLNTLEEYFQEVIQVVDQIIQIATPNYGQNWEPYTSKNIYEKIQTCLTDKNYPYLIEDIKAILDESKVGVCRIRDIVKGLKCVSHSQIHQPREININDQIQFALNVIQPQIKDHCTIHKKLGDLPLVTCYPDQLSQVFMNLIINAYQAIESQGDIYVETHEKDGGVEIKVSDTGCGIPQENLHKLFTPFFTTKPVGEGTGLGLSISYDIIKAHKGRIAIESSVSQGTTVTIWLPLSISSSSFVKKEKMMP